MHVLLELQSYIAHPYWPARNEVIEIDKKSGVNRQKSDEKRMAALKAECDRRGLTYDDYLGLRKKASEQWYRKPDGRIFIPRHQIAGAIVQTISTAPKALRGPFDKDNFRALLQIGDFETECTEPSGVYGRFVKLEGSNQRSWQENEYLGVNLYPTAGSNDNTEPFRAQGVVTVADPKQEDTVKSLIRHTIEVIGLGAARKMGFGRGRVIEFN